MKFWIALTAIASLATADYTPVRVPCPETNLTRPAVGLNPLEAAYIEQRHVKSGESLKTFLKTLDIADFDVDAFLDESSPKLAVAIAGGGVRASLFGAGVLAGLDDRVTQDGTAGFLQATDYIAGLSGGSWLVGLLCLSDWIASDQLVEMSEKMHFPGTFETFGMCFKILKDTVDKKRAGYQTSVVDQWGRLFHYITAQAGLNYTDPTWSGIRNLTSFKDFTMPFPIITSTSLFPGTSFDVTHIDYINPMVEMTPFEVGSWDRNFRYFADTEFIGTEMEDAKPKGQCVRNYDNHGLFLGSSGGIFNADVISGFEMKGQHAVFLTGVLDYLDQVNEGEFRVGLLQNPFYKIADIPSNQTISRMIYLCDGGFEKQQNIPLLPFLQPEREIDLLLATDPSTDTLDGHGWPNGASLRHTKEKSDLEFGKGIYPEIPDEDEYLNANLSMQPAFFGCDLDTLKQYNNTERYAPVIVNIPMGNLTYASNFSTGKFFYTHEETQGTYLNAYNMVTRSNLTEDENWGVCLGCVSLLREFQRRSFSIPSQCQACFDRYCYN
ncbi:Lysophospholipase 2 [Yarrowia sp. B02]|nr:Lysophospholipase 2 [Yarrowia sp. B02]